jgi:hypothetical protein
MSRKDPSGKIHIVNSSSKDLQNKFFYSEQGIGESGVYRVHHDQHGLPSEVTLRAGQTFPGCSKCSEPVRFELVRSLLGEDTGFFVNLYNLPATDAPAVHSDSHIHAVANPQQQREHDSAEAFMREQRERSKDSSSDDENEAA